MIDEIGPAGGPYSSARHPADPDWWIAGRNQWWGAM